MNDWNLKYWNSPEWEAVNARLDYLDTIGHRVCPARDKMFAALSGQQVSDVRVVIVGQDPYPNARQATGRAFEVPCGITTLPPTLKTIFAEYRNDLGLPMPSSGDLSGWVNQGVLLWNAIPSTSEGTSLAHDWREYDSLTSEVLGKCSEVGCVFCFLGAVARRYAGDIDTVRNRVVETSHPSPRGSLNARTPFVGSRIFTRINSQLREIGREPIDWRLP